MCQLERCVFVARTCVFVSVTKGGQATAAIPQNVKMDALLKMVTALAQGNANVLLAGPEYFVIKKFSELNPHGLEQEIMALIGLEIIVYRNIIGTILQTSVFRYVSISWTNHVTMSLCHSVFHKYGIL